MNCYECVFIGRQNLSQQQMEALGGSLGVFISQNGGNVARSEYCGFRSLAYPIKKSRKGHYYIMHIKASPKVIAELNRKMKINEDIIRFLIVKVDKFDDRDNLITQMKTLAEEFGAVKDKGYRPSRNSAESVDQTEKSLSVAAE